MDTLIFRSFILEIFLLIGIFIQLIYNTVIVTNVNKNFPIVDKEIFFQSLFIFFCCLIIMYNTRIIGVFSNHMFFNDTSTYNMKVCVILLSILISSILKQTFFFQRLNHFEYIIFFSISVLALLLMISARDLIAFYLTMELQSLCFYILAALKKNSTFSIESGLKYFIFSSIISGFYLFGTSLIYGSIGTVNLEYIQLLFSYSLNNYNIFIDFFSWVGIIFIIITLLFKLGCAPFHFWVPDVYEGSPLSSTIIFSLIPKISIVYFMIRWVNSLNVIFNNISVVFLLCGFLSCFIGVVFSFNQQRLKRLLIYSSIAQIGYLISGLCTNTIEGFSAVYFYLFIYLITSFLIWGCFSLICLFRIQIEINDSESFYISSFSNYFRYYWVWALLLGILFFSVSGIPPFIGFLSKINIFLEIIYCGYIYFSILLLLISTIGVYYYIRLIKLMFFEPNLKEKSFICPVFYTDSLDSNFFCFILFLFLLLFLFFFPYSLKFLCEISVLSCLDI